MNWKWLLLLSILMIFGCKNSTVPSSTQPITNSTPVSSQTCPQTCPSSPESAHTCRKMTNHCFAQAAVCCQKLIQEDMRNQRYSQALEKVREAIFKAQAHQKDNWLFRWEWELGRIFKQRHQLDEAISAYQRALTILFPAACASNNDLKSLRKVRGFNWDLSGPNTYEHIHRFLEENIDLLLQKASSTSGQHKEEALLQVQKGIEVLKRADLENYFGGECIQKRDDSSANIELGAETAVVIYPILLPERLELLVLLSGERLLLLPAQLLARDQIETSIEKLRNNWQVGPNNPDPKFKQTYLHHAQQLYQWLIVPLKAALPQSVKVKTLVFVSSGKLLTINPSAFHDGKHFLLEEYAVAIIPGLSLLNVAQSSQSTRKERILMAMTEPVDNYPELYFGKKEFKVIERDYKPNISFLDQDFTKPNWQRLHEDLIAEEVEVMHIISHAHFAKKAENNFIKTFDGQLSFAEFKDLFGKLKFPINLLLLSACSTAEGDEAQWASLGLSGLAIKTGVQSSLATLWKAHDASTYFLVTDFYKHWLQAGKSKAQALQEAQKRLLKSEYNHPFYWAHLILVGDWK